MFTAQDIIEPNYQIKTIWNLGMNDESISKEEIITANIEKIVNEIQMNEGITPHLSGILLHGIAILYSKKTIYILDDCNDVIAKISLKKEIFHGSPEVTIIKDKIDPETLEKWKGTNQIDDLIAETGDESDEQQVDLILPNQSVNQEIERDSSNINMNLNMNIYQEDTALGDSFIPDENFGHQKEFIPDLPDLDDEIFEQQYVSDHDADQNDINENFQYKENNNYNENSDFKKKNSNKNKKKSWQMIDPSPILSLSEISQQISDSNSNIVIRPLKNSDDIRIFYEEFKASNSLENNGKDTHIFSKRNISKDVCDIFSEARAITTSFINELYQKLHHIDLEDNDPIPPNPIDCNNDDLPSDHSNDNDDNGETISSENDEYRWEITSNLLQSIKYSFKNDSSISFLDIAPKDNRRSLALSFYQTLCFGSEGMIELSQLNNELPILLSPGPSFSFE